MAGTSLTCTVRQRRSDAGLSQRELAERVGVSRQALIAIEAGRQVPSTALALQLARALSCAVEDLFVLAQPPLLRAVLAAVDTAARGRVVLGRVDGTWVAHPLADSAHPGDGLLCGPADTTAPVEPLAEPDALAGNVLVAGCAPLIGLLANRLGRRYRDARATWLPANSRRALAMLEDGLVHVAGVHVVDARTPGGHEGLVRERFPGHATEIVNLTRWRQGLLIAPGNPRGIRSVGDVLRPDVRLVQREAGAGAHALLRRCLADSRPDEHIPASGPIAHGHLEVARLVRWGVADAGVAIEAAALAEGLDFIPLAEERFDLLVPRSRVDAPAVARLFSLIDKPLFRAEAAHLPGYDLSMAGHAATVAARIPTGTG